MYEKEFRPRDDRRRWAQEFSPIAWAFLLARQPFRPFRSPAPPPFTRLRLGDADGTRHVKQRVSAACVVPGERKAEARAGGSLGR